MPKSSSQLLLLFVSIFFLSSFTSPLQGRAETFPPVIGVAGTSGDDSIDQVTPVEASIDETTDQSGTLEVTATGIDVQSGNDSVTTHSEGSIVGDADATAEVDIANGGVEVMSSSTGINTGSGTDDVTVGAPITTTSDSTAKATTDDDITAVGDNCVDVSASATAEATGISSGVGNLTVTNTNTLTVNAEANAAAGKFTTQLVDKSSMDGGVTAEATAIGIFGGHADGDGVGLSDTITNEGLITSTATAKADNSEFRSEVMDWAVADTTASATGEATGIKSGPGTNTITNGDGGTIESTATTTSELWKAECNLTDWGLGASGLTLKSKATGIEGNDDIDQIYNSGLLTATATSGADKVTINFSFIDLTIGPGSWGELLGTSAGSADTLSKATAVGISGESGDDTISNTGTVNATATSTLTGTAVSIGAEGIPSSIIDVLQGKSLASNSPIAKTFSIGMRGGDGQDTITNEGPITVDATSTAEDISVNLSLPILEPLMDMPSPAFALGGAGVTSLAESIGIEGGGGDDSIAHNGNLIDVDATSTTTGVTASVALQGFFDSIDIFDLQASVADTSLKSESVASGIDGGEGNDTITVADISILNVDATATATSTEVSAGVQGKVENALNVGVSLARADTTATAIATGLEGGEGDDTIDSAGTVTVTADPSATSKEVVAEVQLSVEKSASISGAIADTSTKALATHVAGISGGDGGDSITNSGLLSATASPEAISESYVIDFQNVDQGLVAGLTYVDAETRADARAVGIDGGNGQDSISNTSTGLIEVNADPKSTSTSVGVTAEVGFTKEVNAIFGGSVTDGTTTAVSTAIGIDAGAEDDTINNYGQIKVQANEENDDPDADSTSVSATVTGTQEGLTAGFSYADAETTAEATAIGIDAGSGDDTITNANCCLEEGSSLDSSAYAVSSSDTMAVTVSGAWKGVALGASLVDASTLATARASGIDAGSGNDNITSESAIRANAGAEVSSNAVSVNVTVAIKGVSAGAAISLVETNSEAVAVGINSGDGDDEVTSHDLIDVDATATTNASSVTVNFSLLGAAVAETNSTAVTSTTGIFGGAGTDQLTNKGEICVDAVSNIIAEAYMANFIGWAQGDATLSAKSSAWGIDAGDREDGASFENTIINDMGASVKTKAEAVSNSDTYVWFQLAGAEFVKVGSTADADATGIIGGLGVDKVTNNGMVDVVADSVNNAIGFGFLGFGYDEVETDISSYATATGINASDGENVITNTKDGDILVKAGVDNLAGSVGAGILTFVNADSAADATVNVSGISSGSATDLITNEGEIDVTATVFNDAGAGAMGLFAASAAEALSDATLEGINSGGGNDIIENRGILTVGDVIDSNTDKCIVNGVHYDSIACARAGSLSTALINIVKTRLEVKAEVTGVNAGAGDDTIINTGTMNIGDSEKWMVITEADTFANGFIDGFSFANSYGIAELDVAGVEGGTGNDQIYNRETMNINARSYADAYAETDFVSGFVGLNLANAQSTATAVGMRGNEGDDILDNSNFMNVTAHAISKADAYGSVSSGILGVDAFTTATATAIGMDAGTGTNEAMNSGSMGVWATSETVTTSYADNWASKAASERNRAKLWANAWGILSGSGDDILNNAGDLTVFSRTGKPMIFGPGAYLSLNAYGEDTAYAKVTMDSTATGIDSGEGRDEILNSKTIDVHAVSLGWGMARTDSNDSIEDDLADLSIESKATATGLKSSGEISTITNTDTGGIDVTAEAYGMSHAKSDTEFGTASHAHADADAESKTVATATGVSTEGGYTTINNFGPVNVAAYSKPHARSNAWADYGIAEARGTARGDAYATGFQVGDSGSLITNHEDGVMTVTAVVAPNELVHETLLVWNSGEEKTKAWGFVDAVGAGIRAGAGYNEITNEGDLIVDVTADNNVYPVGGGDYSYAEVSTDVSAVGINAGVVEGNETGNFIISSGNIEVSAEGVSQCRLYADADVKESKIDTTASAFGIQTGIGNDSIMIGDDGELEVMATSYSVYVGSQTDSFAIGINAGDGDNLVENRGHISVSADSTVLLTGIVDAESTGIQTGSGDDIIINSGTIETIEKTQILVPYFPVIKSGIGKGITSGGGNDQLFLMNDSVTIGHIDLGEGDDSLVFSGTPQVEGDLTGSAGIDSLVFDGPGSIALIPMAFENALKQGAGTYSTASLPTMQRIEVNQGTLQIESNYIMATDSIFQTQVNGDGSLGQLNIKGNTQLNGELNVVKGPGLFRNGIQYDILRANDVGGVFSSESLPEDKPLLSFQAVTYPERVEVETLAKSFTSVATNSLERTIAQYLDNIIDQASSDLLLVLGDIQELSEPDFTEVFAGLSPDSYINSNRIIFSSTQQHIRTIQQRMHSLRANLKIAVSETRPEIGVWMQKIGQWGDQEGENGFTGYDYDLNGGALGFDRFLKDHALLGFSLGASKADIDFKNNLGESDVDAFMTSLYGSWFTERHYLDASLSYGNQDYDNYRNITIGGIDRNYTSNHDGTIFSGYMEGGYNFSFGRWMLGPFAVLNYLYLDEDSFTESGDGVLNLVVEDRQTDAFFSQLGVVMAGGLTYENYDLMPEFRLAWKHDFDIDEQVFTAAFAGATDVKFSIEGQNVERNSFLFEAGVTFFHKNGLSFPIKYSAELRSDYKAHGLFCLIRYEN